MPVSDSPKYGSSTESERANIGPKGRATAFQRPSRRRKQREKGKSVTKGCPVAKGYMVSLLPPYELLKSYMVRAAFPPAFRPIFEASPAAVAKIKGAAFVQRSGRSDSLSWTTRSPELIPIEECLAGPAPTSDSIWDAITKSTEPEQAVEVVVNAKDGTQVKDEAF